MTIQLTEQWERNARHSDVTIDVCTITNNGTKDRMCWFRAFLSISMFVSLFACLCIMMLQLSVFF